MGIGVKVLRVAAAGGEDKLHVLPGRAVELRPGLPVVVVQAEGVEGLIPQVQQGGELRDLLLAAQVLQAVAHGRAPPAPVVAQGTVRGLLQGVGGVAGLVQ